jgi:hypothetical protein
MDLTAPRMRRRILLGMALAATVLPRSARARDDIVLMTIRLAFGRESFTATLFDIPASRELAGMLPLDLTISDYSTNEKIAYLPRKLTDLTSSPVPDPTPGDLCYFAPWGNLAFFHGSYQSKRDLVRLGRLDGGVEPLLTRGEFPLRITAA